MHHQVPGVEDDLEVVGQLYVVIGGSLCLATFLEDACSCSAVKLGPIKSSFLGAVKRKVIVV